MLVQAEEADRLEEPQRAHGIDVGRVFRGFEADRHVRLSAQVVDLVGLYLLQDTRQVRGIGQVAIVQDQLLIIGMRILVDMVDTLGVERRRTTLNAVNLIAFGQEKLSQIGSILSGNAGN